MAFVPLGTPLLAGPGAIVATMLFVQRIHNGAQVAGFAHALCAVIVVPYLAMRFCGVLSAFSGTAASSCSPGSRACCCPRSRSSSWRRPSGHS